MSPYRIHRSVEDRWNHPKARLSESARLIAHGPLRAIDERPFLGSLRAAMGLTA